MDPVIEEKDRLPGLVYPEPADPEGPAVLLVEHGVVLSQQPNLDSSTFGVFAEMNIPSSYF